MALPMVGRIRFGREAGARASLFGCEKQIRESSIQFLAYLLKRHQVSRSRGAFDLEMVSVEGVISLERFNQQEIDGKPDWAAPIRVAPKHETV